MPTHLKEVGWKGVERKKSDAKAKNGREEYDGLRKVMISKDGDVRKGVMSEIGDVEKG